jgi:replicative DNA helicase
MGSKVSFIDIVNICTTAPLLDMSRHVLILRDYSLRRKLYAIAGEMMSKCADPTHSVEEVHGVAVGKMKDIFADTCTEITTLQESYKKLQEHMLIRNADIESQMYGTPTGFADLDRNGGLCPGDLVVVGAETSQGKTSFATALAVSALKHKHGVAFYSMEMTELQLSARIASMLSGISSSRILYDRLSMNEIYTSDGAMESIDTSLLYFDMHPTASIDSILMSIRTMVLRHGVKGVVIDYLQLLGMTDRRLNREQVMAQCARELKNIAKELGIWVILISQLSRNPGSAVPSLSRLRDSGQIEEAADTILLIYRPKEGMHYPEPYTTVDTKGTAMIMIAKGRNIGIGSFICGFSKQNTLFYPLSKSSVEAMRNSSAAVPAPTFYYGSAPLNF